MLPISMIAAAVGSASLVSLDGTSGSPRVAFDESVSPSQATVDWQFRTDGTIYKVEGAVETLDANWWDGGGSPPTTSYWIRFTNFSGDSPDAGDTLNTWHQLGGVQREIGQNRTAVGTELGVTLVEIAKDSGGSYIVATGYYSLEVDVAVK